MRLRPMTEAEYRAYLARAVPDGAQAFFAGLLPDGLQTPGQFFLHLQAEAEPEPVGHLWCSLVGRGRGRLLYLYDIEVYPPYRRRGYASAALARLEAWGQALGAAMIVLHLADNNPAALNLYRKCGYTMEGLWGSKDL